MTTSSAVSLKGRFPMLREREEVLAEIRSKDDLNFVFASWTKEQQDEFLDFCTGVRGVKLLYDQFFKEIINPDAAPERLEAILSLLLKNQVKILKVLPNESRMAAENSLLILDVVVQLVDGSIANVEVQKIGYAFPGQRSACYSADLLLRQYVRVKGEKGRKFSYRDIKKVYSIVFFEQSSKEFHQCSAEYIHCSRQKTDSGVKIELLQEYVFVALDIFREKLHNKGVEKNNSLEAWLAFLSEDDPEIILELIEEYPEFESLYREVFELCRNTERIMELFSKELAELDKNTVQYMIDELQEQLNQKDQQLNQQALQLAGMQEAIEQLQRQIKEMELLLEKKN